MLDYESLWRSENRKVIELSRELERWKIMNRVLRQKVQELEAALGCATVTSSAHGRANVADIVTRGNFDPSLLDNSVGGSAK